MPSFYNETQELLRKKSDLLTRLKLMPYIGSPEVKTRGDGKYLYVRNKTLGKHTSTYVGIYSNELFEMLFENAKEIRLINKELRKVELELAKLGYIEKDLSFNVLENIEFARINMKNNIYDQAILEGIETSFIQTEDIITNGQIIGVDAKDVQKILNLKHAWEFILDTDVISCDSDYYMLSHIGKLVNEGLISLGGRIRGLPIRIGGSTYIPPIPKESEVKDRINALINLQTEPIDMAIRLCLYCMKTQVFLDGNKRSAIIFANHFLISHGCGFLVIPKDKVLEFKKLLISFYEGENADRITKFMKLHCWKTTTNFG